jgi:hypothetical protein
MNSIKIPVNHETISTDVFPNNGFTRYDTCGLYHHDAFASVGICTSPYNSEHIFEKNGRLFIFDGWSGDEYGRMGGHSKYINALDVTDIVKEAEQQTNNK